MTIEQGALDDFWGRFVGDLGATISAPLVVIGDRPGLYKALADGGPQTPAELAEATGCVERYVEEWLCNQAAGGYISFDPATQRFGMTEEQAFCLADADSPAYLPGGMLLAMSTIKDHEKIEACFRSGESDAAWAELLAPAGFSRVPPGRGNALQPDFRAAPVTGAQPALAANASRFSYRRSSPKRSRSLVTAALRRSQTPEIHHMSSTSPRSRMSCFTKVPTTSPKVSNLRTAGLSIELLAASKPSEKTAWTASSSPISVPHRTSCTMRTASS